MKKDIMKALLCLASAVLAISMASCGGKKQTETSGAPAGELLTAHARLLRMERMPQYIKVDIANPWDTAAAPLGRYVLVERGVVPDSLPEGYRRLDVPLQRSLVYSSVHTGALAEMGASDAVAAVADGRYFTDEPMRTRIASGAVADVGSSTSPSVEKIVAIGPDAVLLSPFENAGHGALDNLGIPLVECADYMEPTPLARAEWIKLLGALYGRLPQADSIYSAVERDYKALAARAAEAQSHPLVLTEKLTSGYWFVPGGASYMARMIEDAGGRYPWEGNTSAGSLQLDFSAVYARAADADVWLIRIFGGSLSLDDLRDEYVLNSQFGAFKSGRVYVANTAEVPLFDEFPFHPERLLAEYAAIFHPEADFGSLRYYRKIH